MTKNELFKKMVKNRRGQEIEKGVFKSGKFVLGLLFLTPLVFAEEREDGFRKSKQHMLKQMEEQISELQTAKNCISSATTHEAIKVCHESLENARRHHRAEELDERIHQLEEEKSKLNK